MKKNKKLVENDEETMFVTCKDGQTRAVDLSKKQAKDLKHDQNITGIETTRGEKLKEEEGIQFSLEETKEIAKEVGKALVLALREVGDELKKAKIREISPGTFSIFVEYKNKFEDTFSFFINDSDYVCIAGESSSKELGEVGVKPSGEPLMNRDLIKSNLLKHFKTFTESVQRIETPVLNKGELKELMREAYYEVLSEKTLTPDDPVGDETAGPETVLDDATDQILQKFPVLKKILVKLMTEDFKEFVGTVDWVSPRPTTFKINLVNGQDFTLRWTGKNFDATIMGKKYYLGVVDEFEQALDSLGRLYQEAPLKGAGEEELEPGEEGSAFDDMGGGGGGEFPGEEGPGGGGEEPFEEPGGEEPEGEEPVDTSGEVDFETGEEPE